MPTLEEIEKEIERREKMAAIDAEINRRQASTPEAIRAAYMKRLAAEQGPIDTAMIAAGKGITDIGRVLGLAEPATAAEAAGYQALKEEAPITTGLGEALPYAAASLPLGGLGLVPRVAGMAWLGAAELGIPALAAGEEAGEVLSRAGLGGLIAGGLEAVFPLFGRLLSSAYAKLTGRVARRVFDDAGNVLPEVEDVLKANNINIDEIKGTAVDLVERAAKTPEEAARIARFKAQGMPFTPGDITGEFAQRAKEARLLELQDEPLAEGLRAIRTQQAARIGELKTSLVETLGDPEAAGDFVKLGLDDAKKMSRAKRKTAYNLLAEKAGMGEGIPIPQDKLLDTIYDDPDFIGMLDGLTRSENQQLSDLMVRYGIDTEQEAVEDFLSRNVGKGIFARGQTIQPLTTKNAENLSQALNAMAPATASPALKGVIGKIKSAVDGGFDLIDEAVFDTAELLGLKKAARRSHIDLMQEFGKGGMVNKLIQAKADGISQVVEASNVFNALFTPGRTNTIEQVQKVAGQLAKTAKGRQGLANLQAALTLDVIDKGFSPSDVIGGQMMFHGNKAMNRLKSLGEREVAELFKTNPEALAVLNNILQTGVDITPSQKEVLKGSAGLIANAIRPVAEILSSMKLGVPMGAVTAISKISQAGADKKALDTLFKRSPQLVKHATFIKQDLPSLAVILGLTQVDDKDEDEK